MATTKRFPMPIRKIDVHCAPKHPTNKALQLKMTEFYDGGASISAAHSSVLPRQCNDSKSAIKSLFKACPRALCHLCCRRAGE
jgi:hypothetical protein